MGFFPRLNIRPKNMTSQELFRTIYTQETTSGISITPHTALQDTTVYTCIKIKAETIGHLPLHLFRENGKKKELAKDSTLYKILGETPCEWLTASDFWGMVSMHLDLQGNFYAYKSVGESGELFELIPFGIGNVVEIIQEKNFGLMYKVRRSQSVTYDLIPQKKIFHVRGQSIDGIVGISPIDTMRETIGLSMAQEKHGAKLFQNGTLLRGILEMPTFFKDRESAKKFLSDFNEIYSGVENAHKTALLEQGVSYKQIGMTAVDAQFLECQKFTKRKIVDNLFQMPLSVLQSDEKSATFGSSEEFGQQFVTYAILPRLKSIERAIKRDLLVYENLYPKFNVDALLRGKSEDRFKNYQIAINSEILSPNEVRLLEDLDGYEGGDEYRTRTSSMKKEK